MFSYLSDFYILRNQLAKRAPNDTVSQVASITEYPEDDYGWRDPYEDIIQTHGFIPIARDVIELNRNEEIDSELEAQAVARGEREFIDDEFNTILMNHGSARMVADRSAFLS